MKIRAIPRDVQVEVRRGPPIPRTPPSPVQRWVPPAPRAAPGPLSGAILLHLGPRKTLTQCSDPSCRAEAKIGCRQPLRGRKAGQDCGRLVCREHVGSGLLCPPHQRAYNARS